MPEAASRRKYKNAPIEEALVEFRFVAGQEWDATMPGKLQAHPNIKDAYSGKPRTRKLVNASLKLGPDRAPDFAVQESQGPTQFPDESGTRLVSLGPDTLGVHVLRPYEGWDAFRSRIEAALAAYASIAEPQGVIRIGVRYINKVVLPGTSLDPADYFRCAPPSPPNMPESLRAFVSRIEYAYEDGALLLLTYATVEPPQGKLAFLLDLDVIWESKEPMSMDKVMGMTNSLHEREGTAFEALITDRAREAFDAS